MVLFSVITKSVYEKSDLKKELQLFYFKIDGIKCRRVMNKKNAENCQK